MQQQMHGSWERYTSRDVHRYPPSARLRMREVGERPSDSPLASWGGGGRLASGGGGGAGREVDGGSSVSARASRDSAAASGFGAANFLFRGETWQLVSGEGRYEVDSSSMT
jgi:hypothetical protein